MANPRSQHILVIHLARAITRQKTTERATEKCCRYPVDFNPIAEEAVAGAATVLALSEQGLDIRNCFLWEELCRHKHLQGRVVMLQMELLAVLEESADTAFYVDQERHIDSWNTAAERLFGYSALEPMAKSYCAVLETCEYHKSFLMPHCRC
jgi:PAS domain-containing protein